MITKKNQIQILLNAVNLRRECRINSYICPCYMAGKTFLTGSNLKEKLNWPLIFNKKSEIVGDSLSPYQLAMSYLKGVKPITAVEVNSVLAFAGISITQTRLNKIWSSPRLVFTNLNLYTLKSPYFLEHIGTIRNEISHAGVYIWTHIRTGDKYVGSSSSLARRLAGYFKGSHADVGKLIPLMKKEGVSAFNLEVISLISGYEDKEELSLEQYFLLHPEYNLNTLRVVNNISGSRSKALYMYTKDFAKLMYFSNIHSRARASTGPCTG